MRYRQTFDNSCGASALLCAAWELGVTTLPKFGKFALLEDTTPLKGNTAAVASALLKWDDEARDARTFGSVDVESALYAVTSGDLTSYSLPSRVVTCARLLGLKSTVYVPEGFWKSVLQWKYADERSKCEGQADVTLDDGQSPGPMANQRELKIVTTWILGLHYVLKRPGTETYQYMDPGDGADYTSFENMNSRIKNYSDTRISILLEKKV